MQYCRIISLDNNNSVKFTSSREDNFTTNDSMVMKIAHAQLHTYTNIMYKFQSSMCKTVGEKLWTKWCPWTDSSGYSSIPPSTSLWGGIMMSIILLGEIDSVVYRFPNQQILDSTKLKEFADDNFKFDENGRELSKRVENTV